MERMMGIEPTTSAWEAGEKCVFLNGLRVSCLLACLVRCFLNVRLSDCALFQGFRQMRECISWMSWKCQNVPSACRRY